MIRNKVLVWSATGLALSQVANADASSLTSVRSKTSVSDPTPAATSPPDLPYNINAIEATECVSSTFTFKTDAYYECIVPYRSRCSWVSGTVTECLKHNIGKHPYTPPTDSWTGGQVTIIDISTPSSGTAITVTTTKSAGISLSVLPDATGAAAAGAALSPWVANLSKDLFAKIFEASAKACGSIARKRDVTMMACNMKDLQPDKIDAFRKEVQQIVSGSGTELPPNFDLTETLKDNAIKAPDQIAPEAAEVAAEVAPEAEGVGQAVADTIEATTEFEQIEAVGIAIADALVDGVAKEEAAKAILGIGGAIGVIIGGEAIVDAQVTAIPRPTKPPQPPQEPTRTSTSSSSSSSTSSGQCAACTATAQAECEVKPEESQGEDGELDVCLACTIFEDESCGLDPDADQGEDGQWDVCLACTVFEDESCGLDPDSDQGQDGEMTDEDFSSIMSAATATQTLTATVSYVCTEAGNWCTCTDGEKYTLAPATTITKINAETSSLARERCPYTALPHPTLRLTPMVPKAPVTKDYKSQTWVPTATPSCYEASSNLDLQAVGWPDEWVMHAIEEFCTKAEEEDFFGYPTVDKWKYRRYRRCAKDKKSDKECPEVGPRMVVYIHYEAAACAPDSSKEFKLHHQDCYNHLWALWNDNDMGCPAQVTTLPETDNPMLPPKLGLPGEVVTIVKPAGIYRDCMWWSLETDFVEFEDEAAPASVVAPPTLAPTPTRTLPPVTAPLTRGHSSPTAVATAEPSCRINRGLDYSQWPLSFVEKSAKDFCDQIEGMAFNANPEKPSYEHRIYQPDYNGADAVAMAVYMHYEQAACWPYRKDYNATFAPGDCYGHLSWLWRDGCPAKGDLDKVFSGGGYYKECMWWELDRAEDDAVSARASIVLGQTTNLPPVTAPLTKGHVTPTAVATAKFSCHSPSNTQDGQWPQETTRAAVIKFCEQAVKAQFFANPEQPHYMWSDAYDFATDGRNGYPRDYAKQLPRIALYMHYEQAACPPDNALRSHFLTYESCLAHFAKLTDPQKGACPIYYRESPYEGSRHDSWWSYHDVGVGGYYEDCMWWEITRSPRTGKEPAMGIQKKRDVDVDIANGFSVSRIVGLARAAGRKVLRLGGE